jgi:hypothetical protein
VRAGEPVAAGMTIGHLEVSTGHCGVRSCLHWGLLRGRIYLDPLAPLGPLAGRVRLLPLTGEGLVTPAGASTRGDHVLATEATAAAVAGGAGGGPPGNGSTGLVLGLAAAAGGGLAAAGAAVGRSRVRRRSSGLRPRGP